MDSEREKAIPCGKTCLYYQGKRDGWSEVAEWLGTFGCGDLDCEDVPWCVNGERDRRYGKGEE